MKTQETFTAGETVAAVYGRGADAQTAAARLRAAGFADVRLSEASGRTREAHVSPDVGQTETDFAALLERAGFGAERARTVTRAVAGGAVLLTVSAAGRLTDATAVLRGESVAAVPLAAVDAAPAAVPVPVPPAAAPRAATATVAGEPAAAAGREPGDRVIPLRAEQLEVSKERTTSEARVRKEVVTEQRTITVPVQREQLVIERDGERDVRIPLSDPPAGSRSAG